VSVPRYHELIAAAMFAYRNYRNEKAYATAIRYLAEGVREEAWSDEARRLVEHYRRCGARELIGASPQMVALRERINCVAANPDARVLILGESGTGKETVALQIHSRSPRGSEPFCAFNCASVAPQLLESGFFGHEKGAFTGADRRKAGIFELANGGTLFLDEIGELPLDAQGVLLRVLEEGRFMRVGGTEEIETDVRLITATNRNLPALVREGKFREDLFMRLNVVQLRIPPLRERPEDIGAIADNWWFNHFRKHLSDDQKAALASYAYPGNVRELLNILERAVVFKENDFKKLVAEHREMNADLCADAAGAASPPPADGPESLDEAVRAHVQRIYGKYGGNVTKTAAALGITRTTLRKWI
jgi:transcriptional regulator with PAS, ATPase and Fis domain